MRGGCLPENMGAHEQFRFSSPSMRFSHLSHVALEISFEEPNIEKLTRQGLYIFEHLKQKYNF